MYRSVGLCIAVEGYVCICRARYSFKELGIAGLCVGLCIAVEDFA